jgi:hypothetical protein
MCWTPNHQNTLEMAQGHISLSISPFLVIYPTHQKATKRSAISMQLRTRIVFDSNLAYLDHSLPPLGLFLKQTHFPISMSSRLV